MSSDLKTQVDNGLTLRGFPDFGEVVLSPVIIAPIPDIVHDRPLGLARDNFAFVHTFPYQTFGDIEVQSNSNS